MRHGGVSRSLATTDVTIFDYKFQPRSLTVSVGATVRWINKDIAPHTATRKVTEEAFDAGRMVYGDKPGRTPIYASTTRGCRGRLS